MSNSGQSQKNQKLHAYMVPANINFNNRRQYNNKNQSSARTTGYNDKKNQSLPSITLGKEQKVNTIRNQIDEKNKQIALMKARLNSLKYQKLRNQKKKDRNQKQIEFIHTVRDRVFHDRKYKQDVREQRQKELEMMKNQANQLRQQLVKNRQLSKSIVKQKKTDDAEEERQRRINEQQYIKKVRSIQIDQNRLKANHIKQQQHEIEQKINQFNQSRVTFAKQNHNSRVQKSLSQKQKAQKLIQRLKKQETRLIDDFKHSQADMLSSIYELESLNPEKKKKNTANSTKTSHKNFIV